MAVIVPTATTPGAALARLARAFLPDVKTRTAAARSLGDMDQQQLQVAAYERVQEWTRQAAEAVRHNGTLNNHLTSISSLAASGVWRPVFIQGDLVETDDDYRAARFAESLRSLDIGRCVRRHETVGAHWIIPWPDPDTLIRWDEASTSELMLPVDPRKPPEITRHRSVGSLPLYPLTLDPTMRPALIRVWRPDDEWREMAWSPVASVLHHVEALHLMNLAEMALDRNRLASSGLLFIPNDIAGIDAKDPVESKTFKRITTAVTSAISDPHSVSSVVPVFLTGPGTSGEQIRHLVTERREDPEAFQARREAHLRELARALSAPAGRVLGTEDQAKYANAAAMDFDTLRTYLPSVTNDIVLAVNRVYRHTREQWGLPTRGYELRLDFDHLKAQEDETEKGIKLHEVGVLTAEGLAEMAKVPEHWRLKPDTPEFERWLSMQRTRARDEQRDVPGSSIVSAPNGRPPEGTVTASVAVGELKVGDHVKHDTTGDYLGVVTDPGTIVVKFDGPREHHDDGPGSCKIATRYEVDKMTADEIAAVLGIVPELTESEAVAAALGISFVAATTIPESFGQLLAGLGDQALDENVKVNLSDVGGPMFVGLGLKRTEMPQLDEGLDEFLSSLSVEVRVETEVDPLEFLSSQSQLSASKAREISLADNFDEIMKAPIPVSNDNYIVDGHHRWVAAIMNERSFTVVRIDLPIGDVLELVKEFSGKSKKFTAAAVTPRTDWQPVLAALAAIDRRLHDRIAAAAEHAMETALRKAGVKIFNKATAAQKRLCSEVTRQRVASTLGEKIVATLGVTEDDLLANALDDLLPLAAGFIVAAQNEAVNVLAAIDPTVTLPAAASDWTASALRTLNDGFLSAARSSLYDPDAHLNPTRGEVPNTPTKIPNRVITDTVAKAGGVTPIGADSVLIGGPGQGATLGTVVASSPDQPRFVYVWYHGSPAVPFPPHRALDGQRFASLDDPRLLKDLTDPAVNWLGGTIFYVGDHAGCTCRLELQLDED